MRKLAGAAFVSLDGVIQAPGGPTEDPTGGFDLGGWVFGVGDDVIDPVLGGLFEPPYALLLGRRTYDIFAAYWPFVEGEMADMGGALTAADKRNQTEQDKVNARAAAVEKRLNAQYTALDTQMASLTALNSYVTQQVAAWSKSSS